MALQASGAISLEDIRGEFNDIRPGGDFLSEYYSVATGIPRKGQEISLSDFYGKANLQMSVVYSNTDPTLVLEAAVTGRDYAPSELVTVTPSTASEFSYTQQGSETRADGTTLTRWYKNYGTGSQTGPFWQITDSDSVIRIKRSSAPIETAVTANPLTSSTASAFGYTAGSETATETSTGSTFLKYTQTGGNSSFPNPIWKKNSNGIMYERTDTTEYIKDPNATTVTTSNAEINVSGGYWWGYNGVKYAKTSPAVTDYNGYSQYYDRGQSRYLWAQSGGSLKTRTSTTSTVDVTTSNATQMGYIRIGSVVDNHISWLKNGTFYWQNQNDNKLYSRTDTPRTFVQDDTYSWNGFAYSTAGSEILWQGQGTQTWQSACYNPSYAKDRTVYEVGLRLYISYLIKYLSFWNLIYNSPIVINPSTIPTTGKYWEVYSNTGATNTKIIYQKTILQSNGEAYQKFANSPFNPSFETGFHEDIQMEIVVPGTNDFYAPIKFWGTVNGVERELFIGGIGTSNTASFVKDYYRFSDNWTLHNKYYKTVTDYSYSVRRDTLVTYTYPQTVTDHRRISQTIVRFPSQIQVTRTDTSYTYSNIQETRAEVLEIVDTPSFTLDDARERLYRVSTTTDAYAAKTDWPAAPATGYNWRNGRTVQNYYLERMELIDGVYVPTALKTLQATGTPIGTGNGIPQRLVFSANADAASELTDFFYQLNRSDANAYNAVNLGYVAPMGGNYPTLTVSGTSVTVGNLESGETYRLKWYGYQETKLAESGGSAAASTGTSSEFTSASIPSFTLSGGDDTRKGMDFYLEKQVSSSPSIWAVVRCFEYFQDTNVSDLFGAGQSSQVVACDFLDLFANGRS